MLGIHKVSPTLRAVGVMSAVAIIAGGVTYAALTSNTAVLADSTIDSATASLKVFNFNDGQYETTGQGFHITGLVPGTGVTEHFYLQNDGQVPLTVAAHVPTLPGVPTSGNYGFSGFDNLKIDVTGDGCSDPVLHTNMLALNAGQVALPCAMQPGDAGDSNSAGHAGNYTIHFDIAPAAITGSQAGVGSFNIELTGTQS
ncbi:MAG TPA: hypothetical protein VLF91_03950 [Candidatus Saccharimonadales bacterium]|nr:hypothetical protein [Candidatus Saccharimonadales bacterium]